MEIVFIDEGESNRAIIAQSLYGYFVEKKRGKLPSAMVATTGKNKSLHMKGLKAIKELGLSVTPCSRKDVKALDEIKSTAKTKFIVLGHDNCKKTVETAAKKNNTEWWAIDNPLKECKNEVKLRFFRRVRDQLWVKIESLVEELG